MVIRPMADHETDHRQRERQISRLVLAISLGAAMVTTWHRLPRALEIDEAVSFWIADRSSPGTLWHRSLDYSATPPLSFICQRICLETLGPHERVLRIPAWVSFLGAVTAIWYLTGRWMNPNTGGLAALLLALHPAAQKFAALGRPYALGLLLAIGAVGTTWSIGRSGFRRDRAVSWFVLNLSLVCTSYLFALLWALELVWLTLATRRGPVQAKNLIILFAGLGLAAAPLVGSGVLRVWGDREFLNWTQYVPPWTEAVALLLPFHWARAQDFLFWLVLATGVAWQVTRFGFRLPDWFDPERSKRFMRFLPQAAVWAIVPVCVLWLIGRFWLPSLATDRYSLIYVPGGVMLVAGCLSTIRGRVLPGTLLFLLLWLQADIGWVGAGRVCEWGAHQNARGSGPEHATSVNERWKQVAVSLLDFDSSDLMLIGSGLTEMKLVPVYTRDPIFQDYVTCRLSRMYSTGHAARLAIPLFWTRELAASYERSSPPRPSTHRGRNLGKLPTICLVAAADTDVLLAAAERARWVVKSWGWVESRFEHRDGVLVALYLPPWAADAEPGSTAPDAQRCLWNQGRKRLPGDHSCLPEGTTGAASAGSCDCRLGGAGAGPTCQEVGCSSLRAEIGLSTGSWASVIRPALANCDMVFP